MRKSGLMNLREGEVGDFTLLKRPKSPFGRLGTAGGMTIDLGLFDIYGLKQTK